MNPHESLLDLVQGRSWIPNSYASSLHWDGSFHDYLEIVESTPLVARDAWQRLRGHDRVATALSRSPTKRGERPALEAVRRSVQQAVVTRCTGSTSRMNQLVQLLRAGAQKLRPRDGASSCCTDPSAPPRAPSCACSSAGSSEYSATRTSRSDVYVLLGGRRRDRRVLADESGAAAAWFRRSGASRRRGSGINANRWTRDYEIEVEGELDPVSRFYYRIAAGALRGRLDEGAGARARVPLHPLREGPPSASARSSPRTRRTRTRPS